MRPFHTSKITLVFLVFLAPLSFAKQETEKAVIEGARHTINRHSREVITAKRALEDRIKVLEKRLPDLVKYSRSMMSKAEWLLKDDRFKKLAKRHNDSVWTNDQGKTEIFWNSLVEFAKTHHSSSADVLTYQDFQGDRIKFRHTFFPGLDKIVFWVAENRQGLEFYDSYSFVFDGKKWVLDAADYPDETRETLRTQRSDGLAIVNVVEQTAEVNRCLLELDQCLSSATTLPEYATSDHFHSVVHEMAKFHRIEKHNGKHCHREFCRSYRAW